MGGCDCLERVDCSGVTDCSTPLPPGKSRALQAPVPAASVTTMDLQEDEQDVNWQLEWMHVPRMGQC